LHTKALRSRGTLPDYLLKNRITILDLGKNILFAYVERDEAALWFCPFKTAIPS
jgi:hypothetical protein